MGSEFREAFNYHLLKLTEHGILKRIYNRWPDTSRNEEFGIAEAAILGFENLLFPFGFIALGFVLAAVTIIGEHFIWRNKRLNCGMELVGSRPRNKQRNVLE